MNIKELEDSGKLIYKCIAGSHAYGLNHKDSDVDHRGIFINDKVDYLTPLTPVSDEVSDSKQDLKYYSLRKFIKLAANANPNIIELLWIPNDCLEYVGPQMDMLLEKRDLFISKRAMHSFGGYAYAQIKRAKGQNKWVTNPQSVDKPQKIDFMSLVQKGYRWPGRMPYRPKPLKETYINLNHCKVSSLEGVSNAYRLYLYEELHPECKGVLRGPDSEIICDSIPKEDEWNRCVGLLFFNETAYKAAVRDWKNYWEWVNNRNDKRWESQENGTLDYDAKNMGHCFRLLFSAINIAQYGEPLVRPHGQIHDFIIDVKNGTYNYDYLIKTAEYLEQQMKDEFQKANFPKNPNINRIEDLYLSIVNFS